MIAAATLVVALLAGGAKPAPKPAPEPTVATFSGTYSLAGVYDGDGFCKVVLTRLRTIGGWRLKPARDCRRQVKLPEDVLVWTYNAKGSIVLTDEARQVFGVFDRTGEGDYVANFEDRDPLVLGR